MNYYNELGVSRNASLEEINCAYRKLAMRWHPDKNQTDPDAAKVFKSITDAYATLSDHHKRFVYDQRNPAPKPKPPKPSRNAKGELDYSKDPNLGQYGEAQAPTHDLWGKKLTPEEKRQWIANARNLPPESLVAQVMSKKNKRPTPKPKPKPKPNTDGFVDIFATQYLDGEPPNIR